MTTYDVEMMDENCGILSEDTVEAENLVEVALKIASGEFKIVEDCVWISIRRWDVE